jgi:hypothetical protein
MYIANCIQMRTELLVINQEDCIEPLFDYAK